MHFFKTFNASNKRYNRRFKEVLWLKLPINNLVVFYSRPFLGRKPIGRSSDAVAPHAMEPPFGKNFSKVDTSPLSRYFGSTCLVIHCLHLPEVFWDRPWGVVRHPSVLPAPSVARRSQFVADREAFANQLGHEVDRCAQPCNVFPPPPPECTGKTMIMVQNSGLEYCINTVLGIRIYRTSCSSSTSLVKRSPFFLTSPECPGWFEADLSEIAMKSFGIAA